MDQEVPSRPIAIMTPLDLDDDRNAQDGDCLDDLKRPCGVRVRPPDIQPTDPGLKSECRKQDFNHHEHQEYQPVPEPKSSAPDPPLWRKES
jgi:hypothetical protein